MYKYSHLVCSECGEVFKKVGDKSPEECTECGRPTEPLEVIASWSISNTASLNVFKIEYGINEKMLVAVNDQRPEWCNITSFEDISSDESQLGIVHHGVVYTLDECMLVRS